MVKNRILRLFWLFVFLYSLTVPSLYAKGKQEQDLALADRLISEKLYDDAIKVLSDFAKRNPNRFDEAQQRLQQVYRIRDEYNSIADEIIDELISEDPDMEKILNMTNRLEELESSTNPQVAAFIRRTRELALFNYNRQRLARILNQGRLLLDQGNYEEALQTYLSGIDIYQDEFFAAGYGEIIEQRVTWGIDCLYKVVETFPQAAPPVLTAVTEIIRDTEQGSLPARIGELYSRLSGVMNRVIELQQLLYETINYYSMQFDEFQKLDSTIGDRNFLSFAIRLIQGRSGEDIQEGMLGAVEGYWNSVVGLAEDALQKRADEVYAAGLGAGFNREYASSRQSFISAQGYSVYPLYLIEKYYSLKEDGNPATVQLYNQEVLSEKADVFLKYQSMIEAMQFMVQGSELGISFNTSNQGDKNSVERWRSGEMRAADALSQEQVLQGVLGSLNREVDALLSRVNQREAEMQNLQTELEENEFQNLNFIQYINNAQAVIGGLRSLVLGERQQSSIRYYTIANGEMEKRLAGRQGQFTEGTSLIGGISRTTEDRGTVVEHFPAEGLTIITGMIDAVAADTREGNALLSRYSAEPQEITANRGVTELQNNAQAIMAELSSILTQGQNLVTPTRNQIAQADAYRLDGIRYFREAQNALSGQNFDTARDRVTRAAEQFNNSLAIQESSVLRNEWYTQLVGLGLEINRLENEMVIRDVREMVNTARTAYFQGSFERAEDLLVRAQNRWHVTNPDDDEEVSYWLNIVRGAVSLRSGRIIPVTAPLYPEMSQLLSEARKGYDEGVRYLETGRRTEGLAKFNEARQKTREVKLMFPVNQEAGMLDLRMDQVIDPRAFESSFEQRLRTAITGTERRSIEAFAELQNLAEINPRYPGMAGIITQAEIAMGIRPPPPDPRAVARSSELASSAQRILDSGNTAQFEVALTQINESISLNPNNTQATAVKDRLLSRMSTPSAVVMNSQDEAAYNQALMEYQRGNYIMALAIVQRLLQNPQYRNISKILELQRRVQALL